MTSRKGISGSAENPDLESRLLRIESTSANISGGISTIGDAGTVSISSSSFVGVPLQVTGLSLSNAVPNTITVTWSLLDPNTINKYEIWVSREERFIDNVHKYYVSEMTNSFTYTKANPGDTAAFYFMVRGVSTAGRSGAWSSSLNSRTGKASRTILLKGAFTTVDSDEGEGEFQFGLEPTYFEGDKIVERSFGYLPIEIKEVGTMILLASLDYYSGDMLLKHVDNIEFEVESPAGVQRYPGRESNTGNTGTDWTFLAGQTCLSNTLFFIPTPALYIFRVIFKITYGYSHLVVTNSLSPAIRRYKLSAVRFVRTWAQS